MAVQQLYAGIYQAETAVVIFYCSPEYDLEILGSELQTQFDGMQVIGCTTAGEIAPTGYSKHSIVGISLPANHFKAVTGCLEELHSYSPEAGQSLVYSMMQSLDRDASVSAPSFALMLIDGFCMREEAVAHTFQNALRGIPLVGGSAGDELLLKSYVYHSGRFRRDSVVLALIRSDLPFATFKSQHLIGSETRMVITEADAENRIVREINGLPAADEYARLIGVSPAELDRQHFAVYPLVMRINGTDYVRSVQKVNDDASLTFYCAIDEGIVLRMAERIDMVSTLEKSMEAVRLRIGDPQLVLASDCILRSLEFAQEGVYGRVCDIFRKNTVVGFCSYGEQYLGIHVNQTFTGVAIGFFQDQG